MRGTRDDRRYVQGDTPANHPYGRHLLAAVEAGGRPYALDFLTPDDAQRFARGLKRTRYRKQWGAAGTFDPNPVDPRGVGLGIFDAVRISVRGARVELRHDRAMSRAPDWVRDAKGAVQAEPKTKPETEAKSTTRRGLLRRMFGGA